MLTTPGTAPDQAHAGQLGGACLILGLVNPDSGQNMQRGHQSHIYLTDILDL